MKLSGQRYHEIRESYGTTGAGGRSVSAQAVEGGRQALLHVFLLCGGLTTALTKKLASHCSGGSAELKASFPFTKKVSMPRHTRHQSSSRETY